MSVAGSTTYTTKYTVTSSVVVSTSIPGSGARYVILAIFTQHIT